MLSSNCNVKKTNKLVHDEINENQTQEYQTHY